MFCAVIVISTDGDWSPSNGIVYVVFLVCTLSHGILASTLTKIMNKLQTFAVCLVSIPLDLPPPPTDFRHCQRYMLLVFILIPIQNIALILATIIALPVGMANKRNDGHFIFANVENLTTWPTGWAFMLAWLSPIWTIGAFDSCVHMSEEASNAAKAVPLGILSSIGMCWGLGFVIVIVLAACIDPNIDNVLGSSFGQPVSTLLKILSLTSHLCF